MDPLTAMALGSTALTSIGKLISGFAGSSLDKLQASIANSNTMLLQTKAGDEAAEAKLPMDEAALQQSRTVASIGRTIGAETGHFAASNLDPTSGSPLLLEGFSAGQGATDLALIGAKAELARAGYLSQSAGTLSQAAGSAFQAASFNEKSTMDIINGITGAATSALSGLSNPSTWAGLTSATKSIASGGAGGNNSGILIYGPGN
jgi:hypothetical protein